MSTRVVVVDDQAMVRDGFSALLAAQPGLEVVGAAADGLEAGRGQRLPAQGRPQRRPGERRPGGGGR